MKGTTEDLHTLVVEEWCRLLRTTTVTPGQTFFEAGGDSLAAIEMLEVLEVRTGIEIPAEVIFFPGTVEGIVDGIAAAAEAMAPPTSHDDADT